MRQTEEMGRREARNSAGWMQRKEGESERARKKEMQTGRRHTAPHTKTMK